MSPLPEPVDLDRPADLPAALEVFFAPHQGADGFSNPWGAASVRGVGEVLRWQLQSNPFKAAKRRRPSLPVARDPADAFHTLDEGARIQWLGHATVLVEVDGVVALIDPIFGRAGVVPRAVPAPLSVDALPHVDAVLLSHGHRDHMDAPSLRALARRFGEALLFVTPLGLGRSLPREARRVVELDWWQRVEVRGVSLNLVPAQHWHQRGPLDRNRALWGGWVIRGSRSVYHSGDTGWFGGFEAIGRVFPGIDVASLPLGAYEPRWFMGEQHMSPEDSARAFHALGARHFMAMHWGTYDLTDEPLDHGPWVLLPEVLAAQEIALERVHVMAHGGALGFVRDAIEPVERAGPA
ncbi:MAG: MBL fold metallo-hydrolase [Alphaproteobacteria bacterium]|nr:MBL fold metallo-hydrolase [Alphaproteobacteria bacterium]